MLLFNQKNDYHLAPLKSSTNRIVYKKNRQMIPITDQFARGQ
jgi:hypothetical protein